MDEQRPIPVSEGQAVSVEFNGSGFAALGWGLVAAAANVLIVPAAWGAVAVYRWLARNLHFSDGTRVSFEGRGHEVWGYYAIAALLGLAPQLSRAADDPGAVLFISIGLPLLLLPITAAVWVEIIRWAVRSVKLSCGTPLSFQGTYSGYLGWSLLVSLSVYTIIGWAWAVVGAVNWLCRNVAAGDHRLSFERSGWGVLWRTFVGALACGFVIPIPWIIAWLLRWWVGGLRIDSTPVRAAAERVMQ